MTSLWFGGVTDPSDPGCLEFLGVLRDEEQWHWSEYGLLPDEPSFMD